MLFTDAIDRGSLGFKTKMKTIPYIIILMLSSLVLLSCNRRERELKKELIETKENLLKTKEEFIEVKEELVITEQLLNESDDRFNKVINRLEVAVTEIQKLKEENDNLRKENTNLKNQVKNKNSSYKPLPEPKSLPEPKPFFFGSNIIREENKRVPITHDEMKKYLVSFKSTTNEIKQYLLSLVDIDKRRKESFSQNIRSSKCNSIIYRAKDMNYYLMNKKKILQNNNSSIQYIKIIQNIQQNLNTIIELCSTHKDLTTKAEMETCTTSALQALERINSIIDNF
ncbi:MAG: hypothetical protein IKX30_18780 [Victivallales bacterium]|nr:hypothetical protein [Victivallales bacterium]